jgi:hypothetical protein
MIAAKILRTHMRDASDHTINEIVENMASKLYFHGHPINRQEAKVDLNLKVLPDLPPELEAAIWELYVDFEAELENQSAFNPAGDLAAMPIPAQGVKTRTYTLVHAIVESEDIGSRHTTERRYQLIQGPQPGQMGIQEDILSQGWSHSVEQPAGNQSPQ